VPKPSTKRASTRTRLLETAGQLFRWQGFHATGLHEVLKISGAPKGSLYHYFPDGKDQLAIEAVRYVSGQIEQAASEILSSYSDPIKALRALFEFVEKNLSESGFRDGCPVGAVTLDVASSSNSIREACERCFEEWLDLFLEHLKRAGLTATRAKTIATLCLASLEGGIILSRVQRSVVPLKEISAELAQLVRSTLPRAIKQRTSASVTRAGPE